MPVLTQLNLNIGTEQNPNMVLHDLHDIRISSTDVNTVTRLLGCDAGVNSIAPLTLANAASLLGVPQPIFSIGFGAIGVDYRWFKVTANVQWSLHDLITLGYKLLYRDSGNGKPNIMEVALNNNYGSAKVTCGNSASGVQLHFKDAGNNRVELYITLARVTSCLLMPIDRDEHRNYVSEQLSSAPDLTSATQITIEA